MSDLISREDAKNALANLVPYAIFDESTESYTNGLTDAYNLICQLPSVQPEIILCKDCRYSECDSIFNTRYCHNKGKAEMVGDNFFCAAGRSKTNEFDR